jgi:hypothetical protein
MRIVNIGFNSSIAPIKGSMALGAPNLVATIYFKYASSALWAGFGVCGKKSCGC